MYSTYKARAPALLDDLPLAPNNNDFNEKEGDNERILWISISIYSKTHGASL